MMFGPMPSPPGTPRGAAVATGGPAAATAVVAATASPGLVLLLGRLTLLDIDAEVRRAQQTGSADGGGYAGDDEDVRWEDLDPIDGLPGLHSCVEGAVEGGSADGGGGDGGDGGGGGD